jgi:NAD-dependent dihydropyrimidine dehydrogenase PreA subunit
VRGVNDTAVVDEAKCDACAACIRTGCPAIGLVRIEERAAGEEGRQVARIDPSLCVGSRCAVCLPTCPQQAISIPNGKEG